MKMRREMRAVLLAAGFTLLIGCGIAQNRTSDTGLKTAAVMSDTAASVNGFSGSRSRAAKNAAGSMMEDKVVEMAKDMPDSGNSSGSLKQDDAKLIRTVDMTVTLDSDSKINDTADKIIELAKSCHGQVTDRSMSYSKYNAGGSITVKIPKNEVDTFLSTVKENGMNVSRINDSTEDVTQTYVDVDARLKVKQTEVERLQSYLEKAEDTETLLKVEEQLTRAISDLESYKAQMNSLNSRIDATTVRISLECATTIHEETTGEMVNRIMRNTFRDTLEIFLDGAKMFLGAIATLIWIIPLGMIVITAIIKTVQWNRGGRKKNDSAGQDKEKMTIRNLFGKKKKDGDNSPEA